MLKPQFEYKVIFGWQTNSYFRNSLPRQHFTDYFFSLSSNGYLILAWASLKREPEKALGKRWIGDTNEKIAVLLAQHETLHV